MKYVGDKDLKEPLKENIISYSESHSESGISNNFFK